MATVQKELVDIVSIQHKADRALTSEDLARGALFVTCSFHDECSQLKTDDFDDQTPTV